MSTTKVVDSMRDVTTVDGTKVSGAVPAAALTNVDLVEGTKGVDIASAGTITIGTDGGYFDITGTTGITAMTVAAGRVFTLQFDGVVTLTHSSTLYLSGAANFTTEANDHMTFISVAANDVRQIGTGLKDGGSPVAAGGGKLLQTLHTTTSFGTTTVNASNNTWTDTVLLLAFTPISATSKIVVLYGIGTRMQSTGTDGGFSFRIKKNQDSVDSYPAELSVHGSGNTHGGMHRNLSSATSASIVQFFCFTGIDDNSHDATNTLTYTVQGAQYNTNTAMTVGNIYSAYSQMTIMEVEM